MTQRTSLIVIVLLALSAMLAGGMAVVQSNAAAEWESCYSQAIELSEDATQNTEAVVSGVVSDITSILVGGSFNEARLDRITNDHVRTKDAVEELQESC